MTYVLHTCLRPSCSNLFRRVTCQKYCSVECRIADRRCCTCRAPIPADQPGTKNVVCRSCQAERKRQIREDPEFAIRCVAKHREKHYGITIEQYLALYRAQGGLCAICRRPETAKTNRKNEDVRAIRTLAVDHDHKTGRIRGLLCNRCNTALGLLGDDWGRLRAATEYLRSHTEDVAA